MNVQHLYSPPHRAVDASLLPRDTRRLIVFPNTRKGHREAAKSLKASPPGPGTYHMDADSGVILLLEPDAAEKFQAAAERQLEELTRRRVDTGISEVGQFMLRLTREPGLSMDAVLGAASMHFSLPMELARQEHAKLTTGNLPMLTHPEADKWPHALVNGPFPYAPEAVFEEIQRIIDKNGPCALESRPQRGKDFFSFREGAWFDAAGKVVEWDSRFAEGEFSVREALERWMTARLEVIALRRKRLAEALELTDLKRRAIRAISVGERDPITGKTIFVGETRQRKRERVMNDYGGNMKILDTPLSEISLEYVFAKPPASPSDGGETARDELLNELRESLKMQKKT